MRQQLIGLGMTAFALAGGTMPAHAQDAKAAEILAASRKAIGNKLDALKTFSVQATVQRNVGSRQMQSESELFLELPDKYVRSDVSSSPMTMTMTTGFNGDRAIMPAGATVAPGGAMVIRMGGSTATTNPHGSEEKATPEQQEQLNRSMVRNYRLDVSRMLLGWFASANPILNAQYTYAGEAESPDGKAYVIDVKDEEGFAARLFIDQNTKLPLMLTYKGRQARMVTNTVGGPSARTTATHGQPRQLTEEEAKKLKENRDKQIADIRTAAAQPGPLVDYSLFFEDWRDADGIKFPHVIRRASEGATTEEWTIAKVKVNPKIDPKKFESR